jgi:hypothetical protein
MKCGFAGGFGLGGVGEGGFGLGSGIGVFPQTNSFTCKQIGVVFILFL